MFRAIARLLRVIGRLLSGQLTSPRPEIASNPHVLRAKFDDVLRERTARMHQLKQSVAGLVAQQVVRTNEVKALALEMKNLEDRKGHALAEATRVAERMIADGASRDAIKASGEYNTSLSTYNDASAMLLEKQARIAEIESDVHGLDQRIHEYRQLLNEMTREIDAIRTEAADAIADVISSKQEKEIADAMSGIEIDSTSRELDRLRNARDEAKAKARVARDLAGTGGLSLESNPSELASSEFDRLIGLASPNDSSVTTPNKNSALSE